MDNANVIVALNRKRAHLVATKRSIMEDAERRAAAIQEEITNIDNAMSVLNDAVQNYLCKECHGTGTVRRPDAAGQMCDETCPHCKGTGVVLG